MRFEMIFNKKMFLSSIICDDIYIIYLMNKRSLNMIEAFKLFWQNYFNIKSRTRRRHYWFAILANCIILVIMSLLLISLLWG